MMKGTARAVAFVTVALALGLTTGCASTGDLEAVRKVAQEAKATADRAAATAEQASQAASDAQRAAQEAKTCCEQNAEKIDRAFRKAIQK